MILPQLVREALRQNCRLPQRSFWGYLTQKSFRWKNEYLERNAVDLCRISKNHFVLEVGFGVGDGLKYAYQKVKHGRGMIFGVDLSTYMCARYIFHCNSFYFWPNVLLALKELHRVMRSDGVLITTLNHERLQKQMVKNGILSKRQIDLIYYMRSLEIVGFEDVKIQYLTCEHSGKPFQAIFAKKI
ncbi:hypothetical protein SNEBB_003105 [Seison nebaliae]|nr:hypothetical protein SNEBB_003105 [Seison nebaliae]